MNEKKLLNKNVLTIAVCWLVYTCSYLGKSGYNANIILMPDKNTNLAKSAEIAAFWRV